MENRKMSLSVFIVSEEGVENKTLEWKPHENPDLDSKLDLLRFIFRDTGVSGMELFEIKRLSKRHNNFVSLNTENEFKEFKRSLKLKGRAKMIIFTGIRHADTVDGLCGFKLLNILFESLEKGFERSTGSGKDSVQTRQEESEYLGSLSVKYVHKHISCDACDSFGSKSIIGVRYKCTVCDDYDLCSNCFSSGQVFGSHEKNHPMVAIDSPNDVEKWGLDSVFEGIAINSGNYPKGQQNICEVSQLTIEGNITDTNGHEVVKGCNKQIIASKAPIRDENECVDQNTNLALLELSLKPLGRSLALAIIKNTSKRNIDINGFRFDVECANGAVSSSLIEQNHLFKPGRFVKLNVRINSSEFNFPVETFLRKGLTLGKTQLNSGNNWGIIILSKTEYDSSLSDILKTCTKVTSSCLEPDEVIRPLHALVLPDPMNKQNPEDSEPSENPLLKLEDYDLVSVTDADDLLSDFEILSRTNSNRV